ncbi:shikimate dehydrogenase [Rhodoblastus acidophilus]|uniref:Shikimate dehydrogenase (NADP(+)) n=1 Tax=Candidatus Rhodoblastus alkanivorans TaxID=2954117 RepID=A0ABS9Z1Q9_9HYPH|nr:shikimate dehydrogenase [Candidatus Rhodoblastus alkanivorans]MCI4678106.1 shikimate dehydrogenase [Candidatus Rhodoblastus alkanivorans]MCI4681553.1 shikimate dehydrogenase [Candidatus Rhodoblastus alkanivorans]MDI4642601.1 shikimate dehydrogenase [Rhodoblastus acidophilus]
MKRAFVVGFPISHSRSPLIHNFWLKKYGIAAEYVSKAVEADRIKTFLAGFEAEGFCGGNVTLPYKEIAFEQCQQVTESGRKTKAVNTIWMEGGKRFGDNTDIEGFLANLDAEVPGWSQDCQRAAVIGAGGAARAVIAGLAKRRTPELTIVNRSRERMSQLADEIADWGFRTIQQRPLEVRHRHFDQANLLINTTSLGMVGKPPLEVSLDDLADDAVVNDIVYAPMETELLREAKRRRFRVAGGLGMLLHQAAPAFERWFGLRPEVTSELRDLVEQDLQRPRS